MHEKCEPALSPEKKTFFLFSRKVQDVHRQKARFSFSKEMIQKKNFPEEMKVNNTLRIQCAHTLTSF